MSAPPLLLSLTPGKMFEKNGNAHNMELDKIRTSMDEGETTKTVSVIREETKQNLSLWLNNNHY